MDVRQLETLRAVRAQDGVTAAAAVLHLTPSAVSQQLAAPQRDVGVPPPRPRGRGGVAAAAAVLHLTPSAVSQQLAALQRDVGVPLTRQVGRRLRLTPAGAPRAGPARGRWPPGGGPPGCGPPRRSAAGCA